MADTNVKSAGIDTTRDEQAEVLVAMQEWGQVLCDWGEEMKAASTGLDDDYPLKPPDTNGMFRIIISQIWAEAYTHGFKEGQSAAQERARSGIAKLHAEIEKLKAAGTKPDDKQEALGL